MEIIAFEGIDKSGKWTQSKMLTEYLRKQGYKVECSSFHRYDTPTGKLIMDWLTGKYPVSQETIELIMSADKQAQQHWFSVLEKKGIDFLILDRYTGSQEAYAKSTGMDPEWVESLQRFMRKPNLQIVIQIDAATSIRRKGKHNGGKNDRYEEDARLHDSVNALFEKMPNTYLIDGLQDIPTIHENIKNAIHLSGILESAGGNR